MNLINSIYGIDFILACAAGITGRTPPIWGFLQHSWMERLPFWEGEVHSRHWPVFVYNDVNLQAALEWGLGEDIPVVPIGSPYLYLCRLLESAGGPAVKQGSGTIVYPTHGDGSDLQLQVNRDFADVVREREDGAVTVCLHRHEWGNPRMVEAWSRHGFRVICHGLGDERFVLFRQHAEATRHAKVVSNTMTTAVWHASAVGLAAEVYGPPSEPAEAWDTLEAMVARHSSRWPDLYVEGGASAARAQELAFEELGHRHLRAPEELRELLGWSGAARVRTEAVWPIIRLRRQLQERRSR